MLCKNTLDLMWPKLGQNKNFQQGSNKIFSLIKDSLNWDKSCTGGSWCVEYTPRVRRTRKVTKLVNLNQGNDHGNGKEMEHI